MKGVDQGDTGAEGKYERQDINLRVVSVFLGGVVLTIVAVFLVASWMFDDFAAGLSRQDTALSPLAEQQVPPGPLLKVTPRADLRAFRRREDTILQSYGWIDRKAGIVRIPIDQAMKLLAERGLPVPARKANTS